MMNAFQHRVRQTKEQGEKQLREAEADLGKAHHAKADSDAVAGEVATALSNIRTQVGCSSRRWTVHVRGVRVFSRSPVCCGVLRTAMLERRPYPPPLPRPVLLLQANYNYYVCYAYFT